MSDADRGDNFTSTETDDVAVLDDPKVEEKIEEKIEEKVEKKVEEKVEEKVEAKADDKEKEKAPEPRIPLSRHKQLLESERGRSQALETQLAAALKAGNKDQAAADTSKDEAEITKLEELYGKQMLDGDVKDAVKTMGEIRKLERGVSERVRGAEIAQAEARAVETVRYQTVVERMEEAYPQINPDNKDLYNPERVKEVLELKAGFEAQNYPPSAALQKAMKYVFPAETTAQDIATRVTPRADVEEVKKVTAEERKAGAVERAIDAAAKTPPSTAKIGLDSDKAGGGILDGKAVLKMSQKDFAKLGDEQLSRLRGDAL